MSNATLPVRAELRLRNDAMRSAREARGWSLLELGRRANAMLGRTPKGGGAATALCCLERFDYSRRPSPEFVSAVAALLEIPREQILPENAERRAYAPKLITTVKNVDLRHLLALRMPDSDRFQLADPRDEAERNDMAASLMEKVNALPDREAMAVKMRFGLGSEQPSDLDGIGSRFGVSRMRAKQIVDKGLARLGRSAKHLAPE